MAEVNVSVSVPKVNFNFKIANISKLKQIFSPEFLVQGVPWNVKVVKNASAAVDRLGIYLYCQKKEILENWSHAAFASFKLLSSKDEVNPVERTIEAYAFDNSGLGYGFPNFIKWNDLLNVEKGYVKDDAITLEIEIVAETSDENKSRLTFENIEKSCDENCLVLYRLTIANVKNLMAVASTKFNLRKLSCHLQVYKSQSSDLKIRLSSNSDADEISYKSKILFTLVSSKDGKAIEKVENRCLTSSWLLINLVSWDELLKPENGFVNDNSIIIEMKIKPAGIFDDGDDDEKQRKIECSICFETIGDQAVSSTKCGHLFCTECITTSVTARKVCPTCNDAIALEDLHPVFLPFVN
ncbi:E3 ubiquitin-protein ligase BRE1-like [Contarinia nasturtii]|uniref:E3 ubiquitin-protein ligase BRE1-like n=1 Tax=Contarinia nasturtii TaxID=265458 RepID=UPI0012D410F1|nr:E3 ubiquitin-protein ligase BRE1-like [Contarinia nasturtii]